MVHGLGQTLKRTRMKTTRRKRAQQNSSNVVFDLQVSEVWVRAWNYPHVSDGDINYVARRKWHHLVN